MASEELKKYVEQERLRGVKDASLREVLLKAGWPPEDIEEALTTKSTEAAAPQAMSQPQKRTISVMPQSPDELPSAQKVSQIPTDQDKVHIRQIASKKKGSFVKTIVFALVILFFTGGIAVAGYGVVTGAISVDTLFSFISDKLDEEYEEEDLATAYSIYLESYEALRNAKSLALDLNIIHELELGSGPGQKNMFSGELAFTSTSDWKDPSNIQLRWKVDGEIDELSGGGATTTHSGNIEIRRIGDTGYIRLSGFGDLLAFFGFLNDQWIVIEDMFNTSSSDEDVVREELTMRNDQYTKAKEAIVEYSRSDEFKGVLERSLTRKNDSLANNEDSYRLFLQISKEDVITIVNGMKEVVERALGDVIPDEELDYEADLEIFAEELSKWSTDIWIGKTSYEITRFVSKIPVSEITYSRGTLTQSGSLTVSGSVFGYNQDFKVDAPQRAISIDEVFRSFQPF